MKSDRMISRVAERVMGVLFMRQGRGTAVGDDDVGGVESEGVGVVVFRVGVVVGISIIDYVVVFSVVGVGIFSVGVVDYSVVVGVIAVRVVGVGCAFIVVEPLVVLNVFESDNGEVFFGVAIEADAAAEVVWIVDEVGIGAEVGAVFELDGDTVVGRGFVFVVGDEHIRADVGKGYGFCGEEGVADRAFASADYVAHDSLSTSAVKAVGIIFVYEFGYGDGIGNQGLGVVDLFLRGVVVGGEVNVLTVGDKQEEAKDKGISVYGLHAGLLFGHDVLKGFQLLLYITLIIEILARSEDISDGDEYTPIEDYFLPLFVHSYNDLKLCNNKDN